MSSSWSEIRSRSSDDPLLDTIADLQNKANQSEAVTDIAPTDKIPPIRIIKSKLEISDKKMMTGYVRPRNPGQTYQMPKEPDNDHLRIDLKFDSGVGTLSDYSLQNNVANVGFSGALPILLKGTEDDGITTGDIVSVLDGKSHHYRIPINPAVSVKQMVLDGKPGISIIYRHFPMIVKNELNSGNIQRATVFSMIENDQVEYAIKAEIDDAGYLYYFFRHQFVNYYVKSTNAVIPPPPVSDYFQPDYTASVFDAGEESVALTFPIPYMDLAFLFNFSTNAISLFINGVQIAVTITGINLVPPLPAPIFPPAFADPPPPPPQPLPYLQPFQEVYKQASETGSVKVNAVTVTEQDAFYAVPPAEAVTEPLDLVYNVPIGITSAFTDPDIDPDTGEPIPDTDFNTVDPTPITGFTVINAAPAPTEPGYELLFDLISDDNSRVVLSQGGSSDNSIVSNQFLDNGSGFGQAVIGKVVNRVLIAVNSENSPTGLGYVRLWDQDGKVVHTFGSIDVSKIIDVDDAPTGWTQYSYFNNSITTPVQEGWRIGFEYTQGGSSDIVNVRRKSTDPDDTVCQATIKNDEDPIDDNWHTNTSYNLRMALYHFTGSGNPPPTPTTTLVYNLPVEDSRTIIPVQMKLPDGSWSETLSFNFDTGASFATDVPLELLAAFGYGPDGVGTDGTKRKEQPGTIRIVGLSGEYTLPVMVQDKPHYDLFREERPPVRYPLCRVRDLTDRISMVYGQISTIFRVGSGAPTEVTSASASQVLNLPDMKARTGAPTTGWQWLQVKFINPTTPTSSFVDWFGMNTGDRKMIVKKSVATAIGVPLVSINSENWSTNMTLEVLESTPTHAIFTNAVINARDDNADFARGGIARNICGGLEILSRYTLVIWGGTKWALVPAQTTGTPPPPPPPTPTSGFQGPTQNLSNRTNGLTFAGELFSAQATVTNSIPTILEFMVFRSPDCTAGNVSVKQYSSSTVPTVVSKPPVLPPAVNANMKDYGGPKWSGATVHFIFAGADWNTRTTPYSRQDVIDKINLLFQSKYFDSLIQYGIKRPVLGSIVTNTTFTLASNFTTTNLNDFVQDSITREQVPNKSNDTHHMYIVFLSSGVTLSSGAAGFHCTRVNTTNHLDNPLVTGCCLYKTSLGSCTNTTSHEIVEMMANPVIFGTLPTLGETGVFGDVARFPAQNPAAGYEICDVCEVDPGPPVNGVNVEPYYSNMEGACIAPNIIPTWISCPTGSTWDDSVQACVSTVSTLTPQLKKTFMTVPVVSLPSATPSTFNLVWQDTENLIPIAANDVIGVEVSGVTVGSVRVMNNLGNGGTIGAGLPGATPDWSSQANYDLIGNLTVPDPGTPITMTSTTYNAVAIKYDSSTASAFGAALLGKIVHRFTINSKNPVATTIPIRYYILDSANVELYKSGPLTGITSTADSDFKDTSFWNADQKVTMQPGYKIVIEFKAVASTDSLSLKSSTTSIDPSFSVDVRSATTGTWTNLPNSDLQFFLWIKKATPIVFLPGTGGAETALALPAPVTHGMKDYGGEKWSGATVHLIFSGFDWASRVTPYPQATIINNIKTLFNGKYFDGLIQYGIKRPILGKIIDAKRIPAITNPATNTTILDEVQRMITLGLLPDRTTGVRNIYIFFMESGTSHVSISPTAGGDAFRDIATPNPMLVHVVPYQTDPNMATYIAVRGIVGNMANPFSQGEAAAVPGEWGIAADPSVLTGATGVGITGYCHGLSSTPVIVNGCGVPKYYSNQDGACIAPSQTPSWIACQTGSVYDEKKQGCFSLTVPAPTTPPGGTTPTTPVNTAPIFSPPRTLGMKDYGGQKLSAAVIHMVYWGNDWLTQTTPWTMTTMDNAMKTLISSHFYDPLIQYGIKRPRWGGSTTITTEYPLKSGYKETDLINMLQVVRKKLGLPDSYSDPTKTNHVLMVIPGKSVRGSTEMRPPGVGGWHNIFLYFDPTGTKLAGQVVYGFNIYSDDFAQMSLVLSHEIVEAITDPEPVWNKLGIYTNDHGPLDFNNPAGAEISDVCNPHPGAVGQIVTNSYYSNQAGGCVGGNDAINFVSCHTGASWNEATQTCVASPIHAVTLGGTVGQPGTNYDENRSYYVTKTSTSTSFIVDHDTVDLSGRITRGGSVFTGYVELNDTRKRTGVKVNTSDSVIIGEIVNKVDAIFKKVGSPANDPITCCVRSQSGFIKATIGVVDSSTILETNTPVTFINTQNNTPFAEGDTLSIEYAKGTATDFIQVRTSNGFFNSSDAGNTVLFESLSTSLNIATPVFRRDLAATIYSGGKPDLDARPIRGVMVNSINSVLYGKAVTEVRLKLRGSGILSVGTILRVKVIRGSDKVTQAILGELDINSISTDFAVEYYFQNTDNTYVMKVGDMIGLEFNHGDSSHYVEARISTTDFYDGQNTVMFEYNGTTYTAVTDRDLSGTMSIGGFTVTPDPIAIPITPPFHYAHEWIIGAASPPDTEALSDPATKFPKTYSFYNNLAKQFRIYDFLLTPNQLQNYYENRFTITPIPKGRIEIVGHDIVPMEAISTPVTG